MDVCVGKERTVLKITLLNKRMNKNPLGYINNQPPALFFFSPLRLAFDIDRNGVVKIDPDPEGLDGRDEAGNESGACYGFEIDRQSIAGAAAEIPGELCPSALP